MQVLTDDEFRALRIDLKAALELEDVALEAGNVISLKPTPGYTLPIGGKFFEARYRTGGLAEHEGDVSEMESAIANLSGKTVTIHVSGRSRKVEVVNTKITDLHKGDPEDGDGDFNVSAIFVLQCLISE